MRVLGLGDNVCDKYLHTQTMYPGGNAMNVAVFALKLDCEAAYIGTFGDDEVGDHVSATAHSLGVDLSRARRIHGENGYARVKLVDGDRVFLPGNSGGIARQNYPVLSDTDLEYIAGFDLIHTSIYSDMETEYPKLTGIPGFISMDFSDCYDDERILQCSRYMDCIEISCADMDPEDIRRYIRTIFESGCRQMVIATRGSRGAIVAANGKEYMQSPYLVKAKDTMGAGDAFIAAFLVGYVRGMKLCVDFPESSKNSGITDIEEYKDHLIRVCMHSASVFAAHQVLTDGSFGFGRKFELSQADKELLES